MTTDLPSATGSVSSHQKTVQKAETGKGSSAVAGLLLFGIRFYQAVFAHHMPVGCKFYPSCSRYAAEAIERHGAARGARLALARLWRCRPFTKGGFDPVPDADELSSGGAKAARHSEHARDRVRAEVSS